MQERPVEKITINEIAKRSGVSKATVSRVINNSKPVSEE
ncbi:MAG: LacI family DNA-binding transcriptional regulator, partial [Eubacteriales bacterium]|nr:LacI family DNA-binding transcriptional regulator [Eubacteriales bacterium]